MKSSSLAALALLVLVGCRREDLVHPTRRDLTDVVFATGRLESVGEFHLQALSDGVLDSVLAKEGDALEKGWIVAIQDASQARLEESTRREELAAAEANSSASSPVLAAIRARLSAARSVHARDSAVLARTDRLVRSGAAAPAELDDAQAAFDRSLGDLRAAQEDLRATTLSLSQTLASSRRQHGSARLTGGDLLLRSPGRFRVWRVWRRQGDFVRKGETVATLGGDSLVARLDVDEASIEKIREGQNVSIELNIRKGAPLEARISRRLPYFDPECQCYPVEARLLSPDASLPTGTPLQANILAGRREKTLVVPTRCLSEDRSSVRVRRGGELVPTSVRTGIVGTEWTEILSGAAPEVLLDCGGRP